MFHFSYKIVEFTFCGISAIFFQCYFMSETQVVMTVSIFFVVFLGIISWRDFTFQQGASLLSGRRPMGGHQLFDGGEGRGSK